MTIPPPDQSVERRVLDQMVIDLGAAAGSREAYDRLLAGACEATGWVMGQVWLPDPGGNVLECRGPWLARAEGYARLRAHSEAGDVRAGADLPGRAWAEGQATACLEPASAVPGSRWRLAGELGITAGFAIPVLAGDRVVAVLEFFATGAGREDPARLDLLASVFAGLGAVVLHKMDEDELRGRNLELLVDRERWQRQASILQAAVHRAADGSAIADETGAWLLVSPLAARVLGVPARGMALGLGPGEPGDGRTGPLFAAPGWDPVGVALAGRSIRAVRHVPLPDGDRDLWLEVSAHPLTDARGLTAGALLTFRDLAAGADAAPGARPAHRFPPRLAQSGTAEA